MIKNRRAVLVNVNYSVRSTTIRMTTSQRCGSLTDPLVPGARMPYRIQGSEERARINAEYAWDYQRKREGFTGRTERVCRSAILR